ncbi:MAG: WXG100 family type VII secretion target [Sporichthyaceae bacterium]
MDGFEVDLDALRASVRGMAAIASEFRDHDVSDLMPGRDAVAHGGLVSALDEFGDRWSRGLNALQSDVREIGARLADTASGYEAADRESARLFAEIVRRFDDGPAAGGRYR